MAHNQQHEMDLLRTSLLLRYEKHHELKRETVTRLNDKHMVNSFQDLKWPNRAGLGFPVLSILKTPCATYQSNLSFTTLSLVA